MVKNLILAVLCLLTMVSCSKGGQEQLLQKSTVRQIDITEMIPIHASSLEYFDFAIKYMDNSGRQHLDTVRKDSSLSIDCYVKTFSYPDYPVACTAIVELIPQVPGTEVVSFTFIKPKPYLLPTLYFSTTDIPDSRGDSSRPEGYEDIPIVSMQIDEFLSAYGTVFSSSCYVTENYDGSEIITY